MRNRAPFVWTPEQPVDPEGFLAGMKGLPARDDGRNRWFLFRVEVEFKDVPGSAPVAVTCDGRYQLFVNGVRAGRGPVRSSPMSQKFDAYDLAPYLRTGPNVVAAIVHALGVDTAWYESVKGMWRPTFGDGGWWLEGKGDATPLSTGTDWRVLRSDAWEERTERMNSGLGFVEWLDARRLPQCWTEPGFDDRSWLPVQVLHRDGGGPDQYFGGIDVEPFPILLPNPLPPLAETHKRPERAFDARVVEIRSDLPVHRQLYEEPLLAGDPLVDRGEAGLRVRTEPNRGVTLLYRFDRLLTGYPFIEVEAVGGEEIDIAVAERLPDEYERGVGAEPRIVPAPVLGHDAHVARYVCRPGPQRFERFEWSAIRWMQVTIRSAAAGLSVRDLGCVFTHYPTQDGGAFTCDDSFLDRLWVTGRDTLRLCMHDAWEDCPSREQRQWLGDVTVEHLAGQAAFGPSADPLTAKYLMDVADSQRPDGLTQMFAPGDHKTDALLIPDWTLQWVLTAGDYLRYTGDLAGVEAVFPAIERALAWFERLRTSDRLVADLPYWHFMDWAAVGRKGEAATLNAQLVGALDTAARLADALEYGRAAARYRGRIAEMRAALERHWDPRRGAYVDIVDPSSGRQDLRMSQHANAAMILWGGAPPERWPSMVARITDPARLTFTPGPPIAPEGEVLDAENGVVLANTFYSHFVYSALARAGRVDLALQGMRERYGPMLECGADTLWESFDPTASLCHGFSASPTHQLTSHVLGLAPGADGWRTLAFGPDLAGLEHAQGSVETMRGTVSVELAKDGAGAIDVELTLPDDVTAIIDEARFRTDTARLTGGATHRIKLVPL
ncbi:MAG TPA: alpha-L-rhamnosidase N-terminal domain-containing protein [Sphingomonadaceae bacterium]|nr:alpha-L-rhamnosidase N-terminal domain-containing protein [Sphingomonadaceae bacterium]